MDQPPILSPGSGQPCPGTPAPERGVGDQGRLEVGRVHRPPEPLRPHLCLHRFADPRGQELATVPIPTPPGGLPGYFLMK